jgi:CBS domain-containing protein
MRSIIVKEMMVPIEEYATVPPEATLYEAVLALEKAQMAFDPLKHKHRAILVLDKNKKVVGKVSMFDILIALEPRYGELEAEGVLSRSGYSPDLIKSMLKDKALWSEPLQFICDRATKLNVSDFMGTPEEGVFIDENATLGEAIQQTIVRKHHSLLVTRGNEVVGILRLSDVFTKICDKIKTCEH